MRDDDKFDDEYKLGLSIDQHRRAEQILAGGNLTEIDEKRDLGEEYRRAVLRDCSSSHPAVPVLMAMEPVAGRPFHVVLAGRDLPDIARAELCYRRFDSEEILRGRLQQSRPGRRADDQKTGYTLRISRFYPEQGAI